MVGARDDRSSTPLHSACMRGHLKVVRSLLAAGADAVAADTRKRSPADVIGEMGYVKREITQDIKTVLNGASDGFRAQAVSLKRVRGYHVCACVCV